MRNCLGYIVLFFVIFAGNPSLAQGIQLPAIFSDGMVFQSGQPVPIWGEADPHAQVTVKFSGQARRTRADADGRWTIWLDAMKVVRTGTTLSIKVGNQSRVVHDALVGEVWFCSGQSNMDLPLFWYAQDSADANLQEIASFIKNEIQSASDPHFRQFTIKHAASPLNELDDVEGGWIASSPATNGNFAGPGYFFGRVLREKLDVPVAIIKSAYGGTRIEAWIPKAGFVESVLLRDRYEREIETMHQASAAWDQAKTDREYAVKLKQWEDGGKVGQQPFKPFHPHSNVQSMTTLYNAMVHPVVPYGIKGVIWYQGETNAMTNGNEYDLLFEALVDSWRAEWNKPKLPFYMAQLASWKGFRDWMLVCDAQRRAIGRIENTGLAVLVDIGEFEDIHPRNKVDVGRRLALWALKHDYGMEITAWSGPLYNSHRLDGNAIIVEFDHVGSGLMIGRKVGLKNTVETDAALKHFEIVGRDGQWKPAQAQIIDTNTVKVWSEDVSQPVNFRYAWTPFPDGANLYNREGLPASLFTTELPPLQ